MRIVLHESTRTAAGSLPAAPIVLAVLAALAALSLGSCAPDRTDEAHLPPPADELSRPPIDPEDVARLGALGYVSWTEVPERDRGKRGVVRRDARRSQPGPNLWNSLLRHSVVLMDGAGQTLHSWQREIDGNWSGHVELFPNGDLLVFHQEPDRLTRLDWDSNILWETPMLAHHDADVADDGTIYVLARRRRRPVQSGSEWVLVEKDYIVVLSPDGSIERRLSLFDLLRDRIDLDRSPRLGGGERGSDRAVVLDPTHANTLVLIREDYDDVFRKGRVLFAARNLSLIGVVDIEREEVVWSWGSEHLDWPHQPALTKSGHVLVFDNGAHRGYSRIVEVEPSSGEIVWEYRGDPPESFFSRTMGGVQLLANGNLLVTESTRGRVFEIDREGEIAWEFFNPDIDDEKGKRAISLASRTKMARVREVGVPTTAAKAEMSSHWRIVSRPCATNWSVSSGLCRT